MRYLLQPTREEIETVVFRFISTSRHHIVLCILGGRINGPENVEVQQSQMLVFAKKKRKDEKRKLAKSKNAYIEGEMARHSHLHSAATAATAAALWLRLWLQAATIMCKFDERLSICRRFCSLYFSFLYASLLPSTPDGCMHIESCMHAGGGDDYNYVTVPIDCAASGETDTLHTTLRIVSNRLDSACARVPLVPEFALYILQ